MQLLTCWLADLGILRSQWLMCVLHVRSSVLANVAQQALPNKGVVVLVLGIILLLLDMLVFETGILSWIGWILIVVGAILLIIGALGRTVGPRRFYW